MGNNFKYRITTDDGESGIVECDEHQMNAAGVWLYKNGVLVAFFTSQHLISMVLVDEE